MALSRYFLVARCPCCCRPIWPGLMSKLLGTDPIGRAQLMLGEVAFLAVSTQGRKGWKPFNRFASLDELQKGTGHGAGPEAVAQLRKLGQKVLQRLWLFGLISRDDLAELLAERKGRNQPKTFERSTVADRDVAAAVAAVRSPRTPDRTVVQMPARRVTRESVDL